MSRQIPLPPPPPSTGIFGKRGKMLLSMLALIIIIVAFFTIVVTTDLDSDNLGGYTEIFTHGTNPFFSDSDGDGLPDKWEIDYNFAPTNPYDASGDPDYDGLTNLQEYRLGTITRNEVLSYQKDLFVEIDYMSGYEPSTTVISYLVSYYHELNINVHVTVDDKISWSQLITIGVSPESLTGDECSLIDQNFHDNPTTHVYIFYAKALDGDVLGWAGEFGAFIDKEAVNSCEGLTVLWLMDRVKVERVVLLHEIGHCINIIDRTPEGDEDYCSDMGCIMASGSNYWNIIQAILQLKLHVFTYDAPRYCSHHVALINLRNKRSVDERWIP